MRIEKIIWAFPSMTQVGLSATIFFARRKKGFPLQSLTQTTKYKQAKKV